MRTALLVLPIALVCASLGSAGAQPIGVDLDASAACLKPYLVRDPQLASAGGGVPVRVSANALVVGTASARARLPGAPAPLVAGDATLEPASFWRGAWSSAPALAASAYASGDRVIARAGDAPLLVLEPRGAMLALDPCAAGGAALLRWSYFPALLRALVEHAAGHAPSPASLAPAHAHLGPVALLALAALVLVLLGFAARGRARDAETQAAIERATPAGWARPGFARPLAGLLFYIVALLLLLGPYLELTTFLVPRLVQPFPEVDGTLATVEELLLLGWALGDFGITAAVVRAVASLRHARPTSVLPHLRLLLRWQLALCTLLGGACAVAAIWVLPATRYEVLARALLVRALTTPLLCFAVLPAICEALQRYDRQLLLELLDKRLLAVVLPIPCVLALRALAGTPAESASFALTGVILGQALATLVTGIAGLSLLRRMGLPLRALLVGPGPGRDERKALRRFGAGIMAGKAVFFVAAAVELALVVARLRGYPTWLGIKTLLLGRLLFPMWLLWPFCESAVPSLAEALGDGRTALARAYVARYLQYGHLFVGTLFALMVGGGGLLVRALLAPEWHPAATLLPMAGLTGLLLPLTWIGDAVQRARGRSGLNATMILGEQGVRLALAFALLPRFGLAGLFVANAAATFLKTLATYLHAHRHLLRITLPVRAVFLGPFIAALAVAGLARGCVHLGIACGLPSIGLLVAAIAAFPLALFVNGLVGGFEPRALAELAEALALVPLPAVSRVLAARLLGAATRGANLGISVADHPVTVAAVGDVTSYRQSN